MSMGKRARKGGAECDVFSRYWRRRFCWTQRAGETSLVKKRARRRERRQQRQEKVNDLDQ